jgi:hypothetical protein
MDGSFLQGDYQMQPWGGTGCKQSSGTTVDLMKNLHFTALPPLSLTRGYRFTLPFFS